MAESVRSVLNVNGQALRFLTDPTPGDEDAFSIRDWIARTDNESSILFITASYNDLDLTRGLMTLWMNLAVNSLMRLPKTRELRTWYLFDEVHALHVLPAIENGLQSAQQLWRSVRPLGSTHSTSSLRPMAFRARRRLPAWHGPR